MGKPTARTPRITSIRPDHYERLRLKNHILYRCFNRRFALLYVGMTNHPERRFEEHKIDKVWWKYVDRITLQRFPSRRMLIEAEAAAIEAEKPKFNIQNPKGAVPAHPRSARLARTLYPHASNFGTVLPEHGFLLEQNLEQQLYPCVECHARAIYCQNDTVACQLCATEWTFDQWFAMTFENAPTTPVGEQIPML